MTALISSRAAHLASERDDVACRVQRLRGGRRRVLLLLKGDVVTGVLDCSPLPPVLVIDTLFARIVTRRDCRHGVAYRLVRSRLLSRHALRRRARDGRRARCAVHPLTLGIAHGGQRPLRRRRLGADLIVLAFVPRLVLSLPLVKRAPALARLLRLRYEVGGRTSGTKPQPQRS